MDILARAKDWRDQDNDEETRAELEALIQRAAQGDAQARAELDARFSGRLAFGTAGLRGPLQAGPMGMNRVLVAQAAVGLGCFLRKREAAPSVVIGYDARKNSEVFARDSAALLQAQGIRAMLLPRALPTPVLAAAVRALQASAGIMVTASHNPPQDNGYKVYLGGEDDGAQIIPPSDGEIAREIEAVAEQERVNALPRDEGFTVLDESIVTRYIEQTAALATHLPHPLNYVYTAMHGVGCETLLATLRAARLPLPTLVAEQCTPDPAFPTVAFPNPEEKGALDLAIAKAKAIGAELIIANDPDADRFAVATPNAEGQWQSLHGNEVGLLLAWHLAQKAQGQGVMASSLVSSPALKRVAEAAGLRYQQTLTGFKWIGRIPGLIFGYEEALGYLVDPEKVHDKDGISAAVVFLDLLMALAAQGQTLADYRRAFEQQFGVYLSAQVAVRVTDLAQIGVLMARIRTTPPQEIAGLAVTEFVDRPDNILIFQLGEAARIIIRPSGTEPKLKCYLDVMSQQRAEAQQKLDALTTAMRALLTL